MKILIVADMEGISGVVYWPRPQLGGRDARDDERQRKAMADDINAVVTGARQGGAEDFYVLDFHGSAPPRPNLLQDDLDPAINLFSGRGHMSMVRPVMDSSYDALMIVGMHAFDGVADGILSHNFTSTYREIYINDLRIGETGYFALLAGSFDIPVVLLTGDEAACREADELLGSVETVATKKGITHGFALLYPPSKVYQALTAGAEQAIKQRDQIKPFKLEPPYRVEIEMGGGREPYKADACAMFPFVERLSGTRIAYESSNIHEALTTLRALHITAESQRHAA
ncbi:MAG: M55 family metallopeptidase [Chloroflexota bacterium]